jgi:ABC-type amino acid transport substrate-binding protein
MSGLQGCEAGIVGRTRSGREVVNPYQYHTVQLPYHGRSRTNQKDAVMNKSLRSWLAVCIAGTAFFAAAHAETLLVYGDDAYQPLISSQNGKPAGVLVDILRKVSERSGDTYELQLFPWKRAYELARNGSGAVVGISMTEERRALFDFSDSLYSDDIQIVVLTGREFPFKQLGDLQGKTMGGVLGASYGDTVDKAIAQGLFKMDRDIGQAGRLHKLLAQRMDGALIGNGQAGFDAVLDSDPVLASRRHQFSILKTPLTIDPLYLAAAKGMNKKAVIERFNKALHELHRSGALRRVTQEVNSKK